MIINNGMSVTKLTNILLLGSVNEHKRWIKQSGRFTENIKRIVYEIKQKTTVEKEMVWFE